jgi:sulfur carrier protein ThiS
MADHMRIYVEMGGRKKVLKLGKGSVRILDILQKLDINRETVLVRKGREIIPVEEVVRNSDRIEIIKIISGG